MEYISVTEANTARPAARQCPFLMMTNLYSRPGSAETVAHTLDPQDAARFRAELAYYRGEIDAAYTLTGSLLKQGASFEGRVGVEMLRSLVAMYRGDKLLWEESEKQIQSIACSSSDEKEQLRFWLAATDSAIYDMREFPAWFQRGSFDCLPADAHPSAHFFYVKHLLVSCMETAAQGKPEREELNVMRVIPAIAEPLISAARACGALLPEIYLRLLCAVGYHGSDNNTLAELHLDRAIELALPDCLYSPLAEYRKILHFLIDARLRKVSPEALAEVRRLNKRLLHGWTKLHNAVMNRKVSNELTAREHEVASLAVFGFSNREIAEKLQISLGSVKQSLYRATEKTGAQNRQQLGEYL